MPDDVLPGNPYARRAEGGATTSDVVQATLAVAYELRTANLIALRGAQAGDDPAVRQRLGLGSESGESPY
jgi:hypothetical protein